MFTCKKKSVRYSGEFELSIRVYYFKHSFFHIIIHFGKANRTAFTILLHKPQKSRCEKRASEILNSLFSLLAEYFRLRFHFQFHCHPPGNRLTLVHTAQAANREHVPQLVALGQKCSGAIYSGPAGTRPRRNNVSLGVGPNCNEPGSKSKPGSMPSFLARFGNSPCGLLLAMKNTREGKYFFKVCFDYIISLYYIIRLNYIFTSIFHKTNLFKKIIPTC